MNVELEKIAVQVEERLKRNGLKGRTVTVKIKYHDFKIITRSRSFLQPIDVKKTIIATAKSLLEETDREEVKVRLLGITLSHFGERISAAKAVPVGQLRLFS
jgi:DNA polymerase-4